MDLHLKCNKCGQKIVVDNSAAGQVVPRSTCNNLMTIPKPSFFDWLTDYTFTVSSVFSGEANEPMLFNWIASRSKIFWIIAGIIGFIIFAYIRPEAVIAFIQLFGVICLLAVALAIYFFPAIQGRRKRNSQAIFILNLFLGWTVIGWVVALVWAVTKDPSEK